MPWCIFQLQEALGHMFECFDGACRVFLEFWWPTSRRYTIELYRRGLGIKDLLWRLRLRHIETLQHYLQEVSTDVTMFDLPMNCRVLISGASEMFPIFLQTTVS